MDNDLQVDSEMDFRRKLKTVDENLLRRDVAALKFLCQDIIAPARLEKISRGLELLLELERKQHLSPSEPLFLAELLLHIGRLDLIRKLGINPHAFRQTIKEVGPHVKAFRLLLQQWCDELTKSKMEELRFLARSYLPVRKELDEAETTQDIFLVLEKNQVIVPENVSVLQEMGESMEEHDLVAKTLQYQAMGSARVTTPPKSSAPMPDFQTVPLLNTAPTGIPLSKSFPGADVPRIMDPDSYPSTLNKPDEIPLAPYPSPRMAELHDLPVYKMDAIPRGRCLIINNRDFYRIHNDPESRMMPAREGTEVDRNNLQNIFTKLQFDVEIHNNLTDMEMLQLLQRTAMDVDHTPYDCFCCCILTHGIQGKLYGVNGRLVEMKDLTNFYKASTCRALKGKPKLFFIQACQGKMKQIGVDIHSDGPSAPEEHGMEVNVETLPNEADFLLGYATLPGFVSYRSKTQGSWYITKLVQMLDLYWDKYDLLSIMIKVNEEVSRATAQMKDAALYKQSPAPVPTLRKKVYFFKPSNQLW